MTNKEVIKMLTAKAECMRRETSGTDFDCNFHNCYKCDLNYVQGNIGDQIEALSVAIFAIQAQDVPDINVGDMISRKTAIDDLHGKDPSQIWDTADIEVWVNTLPSVQSEPSTEIIEEILDYLDTTLHPIVSPDNWYVYSELYDMVSNMSSAQPEPYEITDEQAILYLQSTGWMQNHDREMYESGLREQLADDSGAYDSLIPCEDTISRQNAIDAVLKESNMDGAYGYMDTKSIVNLLNDLPFAQPEQRWIPCSETVDIPDHEVLCCDRYGEELIGWLSYNDDQWLCESDGEMMYDPIAWREKPEPYRAERRTDERTD